MGHVNRISTVYRVEEGILTGTEITPFMALLLVKYPHRKSKDCYIPPIKTKDKEVKTWHCCQENCPNPDFEGDFDTFLEHLMLHKGRLLKPWTKKQQLKSPIPAVRLPPNEWEIHAKQSPGSTNEDRRFCVQLYIDNLKFWLRRQGLEIL